MRQAGSAGQGLRSNTRTVPRRDALEALLERPDCAEEGFIGHDNRSLNGFVRLPAGRQVVARSAMSVDEDGARRGPGILNTQDPPGTEARHPGAGGYQPAAGLYSIRFTGIVP